MITLLNHLKIITQFVLLCVPSVSLSTTIMSWLEGTVLSGPKVHLSEPFTSLTFGFLRNSSLLPCHGQLALKRRMWSLLFWLLVGAPESWIFPRETVHDLLCMPNPGALELSPQGLLLKPCVEGDEHWPQWAAQEAHRPYHSAYLCLTAACSCALWKAENCGSNTWVHAIQLDNTWLQFCALAHWSGPVLAVTGIVQQTSR